MPTITLADLNGMLREAARVPPAEEERQRQRRERARLDIECSFQGAFHLLMVANLAQEVSGFPDLVPMGLGIRGEPAPSIARGPDGLWRWQGTASSFQAVTLETAMPQTAYGAVLGALNARHCYETASVLARVSGWDAPYLNPTRPTAPARLSALSDSLPSHVLSALLGYGYRVCERVGVSTTVSSMRELTDAWTETVLRHGVDIDAAPAPGQDPPLVSAAKAGDGWTLQSLLRHGAKVDVRDPEGLTAFLAAARSGKRHAVRVALEHGADPAAASLNGRNVFHCIAEAVLSGDAEGAMEVFDLVKDLGADPFTESNFGYTPLMLLAEAEDTHDLDLSREDRRIVQTMIKWLEDRRPEAPAP